MAASALTGYQNTVNVVFDMTSSTVGASETFTMIATRAFRVVGVIVNAKATQAGGTAQVKKAGANITEAIACDTVNSSIRASTITQANADFAVGNSLQVTVATAGTRGTIVVQTIPLPLAEEATISAV